MPDKQTYQYSRVPIGIPSVLLAVAWGAIWLLWPSLSPDADGARRGRVQGATVSYGEVQESLYMSPSLFARSTRIGFRAPEGQSEELAVDGIERERPRTRFLHVRPPEPDYAGMRVDLSSAATPTKRVDGYRPVWKDESTFSREQTTNAVVVEVRGALKVRRYQPAELAAPEEMAGARERQVTAVVAVGRDGTPGDVFVESGSGELSVDAAVVRALERGAALPADGPASGRVIVTIRRAR